MTISLVAALVCAPTALPATPDSSVIWVEWVQIPCMTPHVICDRLRVTLRQRGDSATITLGRGAYAYVAVTESVVSCFPMGRFRELWQSIDSSLNADLSFEPEMPPTSCDQRSLDIRWSKLGVAKSRQMSAIEQSIPYTAKGVWRLLRGLDPLKYWATVTPEVLLGRQARVGYNALCLALDGRKGADTTSEVSRALHRITEDGHGADVARVVMDFLAEDAALLNDPGWLSPPRGSPFNVLARLLPYSDSVLQAGLSSSEPRYRLAALKTFLMTRDPRATAVATSMLRDPQLVVRSAAAFGLLTDSAVEPRAVLLATLDSAVGGQLHRTTIAKRLLAIPDTVFHRSVIRRAPRATRDYVLSLCRAEIGLRDTLNPDVSAMLAHWLPKLADDADFLRQIGYRRSDVCLTGALAALLKRADTLPAAKLYIEPLSRLARYDRRRAVGVLTWAHKRWPKDVDVWSSLAKANPAEARAMIVAAARDSAQLPLGPILAANEATFQAAIVDPDPRVRLVALRVYRQKHDSTARVVYRRLIHDPVLEVRSTAAFYLVRNDREACVPVLLEALDSTKRGDVGTDRVLDGMLSLHDSAVTDTLISLGLRRPDVFGFPLLCAQVGKYSPDFPRVHELLMVYFGQFKMNKYYYRQVGHAAADTTLLDSIGLLISTADTSELDPVTYFLAESLVRLSKHAHKKALRTFSELHRRRPSGFRDARHLEREIGYEP